MINNHKYFDHLLIVNRLSRSFKGKQIEPDDIMVWCQEVELELIKDINYMVKYEEIDLLLVDIGGSIMAKLPCNIFKLEDVFDGTGSRLLYQNNGDYLYGIKDMSGNALANGTTIYINYRGTPIDEVTGMVLCLKGHEKVCETYCKIMMFEEEITSGKISPSMWTLWNQQIAGQRASALNDYTHMDRAEMNDKTIIRGNMVPKIGHLPLSHTILTTNDGSDQLIS